jgi:hypothetical protein
LRNTLRFPRLRLALARAAVLLSLVALVWVPTAARMGQKLETATHAPSFRNIDCPPKKISVAPVASVVSPATLRDAQTVRVAAFSPAPVAAPPRSPFLFTPRPLRAPPYSLFA